MYNLLLILFHITQSYFSDENLSGLSYQLQNPQLKHICDILVIVQSLHVRQFLTLIEEVERNLKEAKSNIEYLQVYEKLCDDLSRVKTPAEIPDKIPAILQAYRFIWLHSPFYGTSEKITSLCRLLSNQIILQCIDFINLQVIFKEKHSRQGISMFQTCIDCLIKYIKTYVLVLLKFFFCSNLLSSYLLQISEAHTEFGTKPWLLDKSKIFNQIDSFIQRCKDMIEICHCMITFGRHDETDYIPKPKFGGARGPEFESYCDKIESMFKESLDDIEKVSDMILDVQNSDWFDEILKFRSRIKDIEVIIENMATGVFAQITMVDDGVEALAAMYNYSLRPSLKELFDRQTQYLYLLFKQEIQATKLELVDEADDYPVGLPYYAGRAISASMKKSRLCLLKKILDDAIWIPACSIAEEIFVQYEKLIASIDDMIINIYRRWVETLGEDVTSRLKRPLLMRSITRPGLLECNIDRSLLNIFHECDYWKCLGFEIPAHVQVVESKAIVIKLVYENVLMVVMDYNKIVAALSDEERLLFKPLINSVEKKIAPGLNKLQWGADVSDVYITECSACTADLQDFLDEYKNCNLGILSLCEQICNSLLIKLEPSYAYQLGELIETLKNYRRSSVDQIIECYKKILDFIIIVFEGFEQHMSIMVDQWVRYVHNFDILMEEALKVCARNSLQVLYEALHGDGSSPPSPVIKLNVNLTNNRVLLSSIWA